MSALKPAHTDSSVIDHHEDGSWTETTVITHYPASKAEKALAWSGVGVVLLAPFVPLVMLTVSEKLEARREKRRLKAVPENNTESETD